jgi:anti-sigma factor RsiW
MSDQASALAEDEVIAKLSDYLDGALADDERKLVAERIERDAEWQRVHGELVETRNALSGMQKQRAPGSFASDVTDTIHKRSAGRFFARRTLGDRVPFGVLLVVAMIAMAVIAYVLWSSPTGSLKPARESAGSAAGSGTELVPKP